MNFQWISIFWSLLFPNPLLMVLKFWKVKYLVLIKVVIIRWCCMYICNWEDFDIFNLTHSDICTKYCEIFAGIVVFSKVIKQKFVTSTKMTDSNAIVCFQPTRDIMNFICHLYLLLIFAKIWVQFFAVLNYEYCQNLCQVT